MRAAPANAASPSGGSRSGSAGTGTIAATGEPCRHDQLLALEHALEDLGQPLSRLGDVLLPGTIMPVMMPATGHVVGDLDRRPSARVRCYTLPPAVARPPSFRAMTTYTAKPGEIQRDWYVVDAEGQDPRAAGDPRSPTRSAARASPQYTPHVDTGDFVIVVNAEKIHVTGKKLDEKMVRWHSGLPGRPQGAHAARAARAAPDRGDPQGGQGDAPEEQARGRAAAQAQGLRRPRASARGAGAEDDGDFEARPMAEIAQYRGTGKRKTSVARVILRPGDGKTWINGRTIEDYFPRAIAPDARARSARGRRGAKARTTSAFACTAAASAARPARSGTASPVRSSRPTPSSASRSSGRASSRGTPDRSSARRPACTRRARHRSSRKR